MNVYIFFGLIYSLNDYIVILIIHTVAIWQQRLQESNSTDQNKPRFPKMYENQKSL